MDPKHERLALLFRRYTADSLPAAAGPGGLQDGLYGALIIGMGFPFTALKDSIVGPLFNGTKGFYNVAYGPF